ADDNGIAEELKVGGIPPLCRPMPPQNLRDPIQAALLRVGQGGLSAGVGGGEVGAGGDQQLGRFGAIVLLRGVHDERSHCVELRIGLAIAAVDVGATLEQHADRGGGVLACPVQRLAAVAVDLVGFDLGAGV